MDVSELRDWVKKMGYTGEISDNFALLNESTAHIWKQVVERLRPKDEAKQTRHNILLVKLQQRCHAAASLEVTECKDFSVWEKKEDFMREVHFESEKHNEAVRELKKTKQKNNELSIDIKAIEAKAQESQMKRFLFNRQCGNLREKVKEVKKERLLDDVVSLLDTKGENEGDTEKKVERVTLGLKVPSTLEDAMTDKNAQSLYRNNRSDNLKNIVWCKIDNLIYEISKISCTENISARNDFHEEQLNWSSKLHALHIESSLNTIKLRRSLETVERRFQQETLKALKKLFPFQNQQNVTTFLEENFERIEVATTNKRHAEKIAELKRDIQDATKRNGGGTSSAKLLATLAKNKASLKRKAVICGKLTQCVHEKYLMSKELLPSQFYVCTLSVLTPLLLKNLETEEVKTVMVYNLEYNRQCAFVKNQNAWTRGVDLYYRDTCESNLPFLCSEADVASVSKALNLPMTDFKGLERYFSEKVAQKQRYEEFMRGCVRIQGEMPRNIIQDDLNDENFACLTSSLFELSTFKFSPLETIRNAFDLWLEMPFSYYVSPSVLFDGKSYEFYEDAFDCI